MKKKSKKRYSLNEVRAYWIGVGISAAVHGDADMCLETPHQKLRRSVQRGYNADNNDAVSNRIFKK